MQKFDTKFEDLLKIEVDEPNFEEFKNDYLKVIDEFKKAKSAEETLQAIRDSFALDDALSTQYSLISVHHTIDTRDEKYNKWNDMFDEIIPQISEYGNKINELILNSPYRKEIVEAFGELFIKKLQVQLKTFSPKVIPLLQEENKLTSEYTKLISSALIEYKGQKLSLPQMGKYCSSKSRSERRKANKLVLKWWKDHDTEVGKIFDKLVKTRTKIATKLGYKNFIQLAYDRLGRTGWNEEDVKQYREQVVTNIVPLANKILEQQKERLGYGDDTQYYDYKIFYKSGNPQPKGDKDKLVSQARKLYKQLNSECSKYFNFLIDHNCVDLEAKPGKAGGGYETYLPCLKTPFIFSNFNGTSGDVDVLTHEFGHALQAFLSADIEVPMLRSPGYEVCEMHSMSMEFLAHPKMELFFGNKADKYRYYHIASALTFIPYGTLVDHFQHEVYENPKMTHKQRKMKWAELEKIYNPLINYDKAPFLKNGGQWMRQHHIVTSPFYYIDYTIAQIVSLEFLCESYNELKTSEKAEKTFEKYLKLSKLGGTMDYKELLEASNIKDPMVKPNQKDVASEVVKILDTFNPSELDKAR